jgi:hypothetical protein
MPPPTTTTGRLSLIVLSANEAHSLPPTVRSGLNLAQPAGLVHFARSVLDQPGDAVNIEQIAISLNYFPIQADCVNLLDYQYVRSDSRSQFGSLLDPN